MAPFFVLFKVKSLKPLRRKIEPDQRLNNADLELQLETARTTVKPEIVSFGRRETLFVLFSDRRLVDRFDPIL